MPSAKEVQLSKMDSHIEELIETLQSGGLRQYIEQIEPIAEGSFTPIEIAAALLKMKLHDNSNTMDFTQKTERIQSGKRNNGKKKKYRKGNSRRY